MGRLTAGRAWRRVIAGAALAVLAMARPQAHAEDVRTDIVASIRPVHALLSGVMAGAGRPVLLVRGGQSPHHYQLKPSEARALAGASAVFWVGSGLEGFLVKPLAGSPAFTVALATAEGVVKRPLAGGGDDPHIWLDPVNAAAMVRTMVIVMANVDPERLVLYRANGAKVLAALGRLEQDLRQTLAPVAGVPFVVFHDAYNHLGSRFGLALRGAVTPEPGQVPGAGRVGALRRMTEAGEAACLFTEPPAPPALAKTLVDGTGVRLGTLDPLGLALEPGPQLYADMMRRLGGALAACLGAAKP